MYHTPLWQFHSPALVGGGTYFIKIITSKHNNNKNNNKLKKHDKRHHQQQHHQHQRQTQWQQQQKKRCSRPRKKHLPWTEPCSPPSPESSWTNPASPTPPDSPAPPTWRTAGCSRCTRGRKTREWRPGAWRQRLGVRWTLQNHRGNILHDIYTSRAEEKVCVCVCACVSMYVCQCLKRASKKKQLYAI